MTVEEVIVSGETIKIDYTIPFEGYLEVYILNMKGKRLGTAAFIKPKGRHVARLSRKSLRPGEQYIWLMVYKGGEYTGSFQNGDPPPPKVESTAGAGGPESPEDDYDPWNYDPNDWEGVDDVPPESDWDKPEDDLANPTNTTGNDDWDDWDW